MAGIRKTGSGARALRFSVLAKNKLKQLKRNGNILNSRKTLIAQGITATSVNAATPYIMLSGGTPPEYIFVGTIDDEASYYKYAVKLRPDKMQYGEDEDGVQNAPKVTKIHPRTEEESGQMIPYAKGYISLPNTRYKGYQARFFGGGLDRLKEAWSLAFVVPSGKAAIPFPDGVSPTSAHPAQSKLFIATIDSNIVVWNVGADTHLTFPIPNVPSGAQFEWRFNLAGNAIVGGEIRDSVRRVDAGIGSEGVHEYRYIKFNYDAEEEKVNFTQHTVYTDSTVKIVGVDFSYSSENDNEGMLDKIVVAGTRNYGRPATKGDSPTYTGNDPDDPAPTVADIYSELVIRRDGSDHAIKTLLRHDGGIWNGHYASPTPYWLADYIAMVRGLDLRFGLAVLAARNYDAASGDNALSTFMWNFSLSPNVHVSYEVTAAGFATPPTNILSPLLPENNNQFEWYTMMFYHTGAAISVNPDLNTGEYTNYADPFYNYATYALDVVVGGALPLTNHEDVYNLTADASEDLSTWGGRENGGNANIVQTPTPSIAMETGYSKADGYITHDLYVL